MRILGVLKLLVTFSYPIAGSRGDQLTKFTDCVRETVDDRCSPSGINYKSGPLPLHLRLLQWTCTSDCDYLCQQAVTGYLVRSGQDVEQFHGKWPFIRVAGVQEPASVIFSIMNGYVHYSGLKLVRRRVSQQNPMRPYYVVFAFVGMNAWLWSTVFHTRDFPATEKLDYFSAGTYVLYGLFYAVVRVFRFYTFQSYSIMLRIWGLLCFAALASHISYLTFIRFDYGYNMLANVIVGSIHGLVWLYYSISHADGRPGWVWWPALIVIVLAFAMSLELFDFAPLWYAVDAHSLWHLSTVPITWVWYRFLVRDSEWEQNVSKRQKKS